MKETLSHGSANFKLLFQISMYFQIHAVHDFQFSNKSVPGRN